MRGLLDQPPSDLDACAGIEPYIEVRDPSGATHRLGASQVALRILEGSCGAMRQERVDLADGTWEASFGGGGPVSSYVALEEIP